MPIRDVVRLPDHILKERCTDVTIDRELARDLVDTMRASPSCVGLAAPQIGVARRAFVADATDHPKTTTCHGLIVMFDPLIIESSGRTVGREGCMSVPDLTADVARAGSVVVSGIDVEGGRILIATEGFEARVLQHEVDHLDGTLILDRVVSLSTDVFRRKTYK